jgi:hypothetical protein
MRRSKRRLSPAQVTAARPAFGASDATARRGSMQCARSFMRKARPTSFRPGVLRERFLIGGRGCRSIHDASAMLVVENGG